MNAIPFETLRELVGGRHAVVLAADADGERWRKFPASSSARGPHQRRVGTSDSGRPRWWPTAVGIDAFGTVATFKWNAAACDGCGPRSSRRFRCDCGDKALPWGGHHTGSHEPGIRNRHIERRTVLVDANSRAGSVEFHVGANPARNVAQLVRRAEEMDVSEANWDALLIRVAAYGAAVTRPGPVRDYQAVAANTRSDRSFKTVIDALKERYRFIFLATSGSGWTADDPDVDQLALRLADRILLVVRPDVEGITVARGLQDCTHRDRVQLVLNQVGLPDQVSREDVEAKLGIPVVAILPFDPRKVGSARARNRPVVCERGSRLAGPLLDLAGRIAGGRVELAPDELPRVNPWWQRLALGATGALR